jgi:hypothetical protein
MTDPIPAVRFRLDRLEGVRNSSLREPARGAPRHPDEQCSTVTNSQVAMGRRLP